MKAVIVNEDHSLSWGEVDHPKIGDQGSTDQDFRNCYQQG